MIQALRCAFLEFPKKKRREAELLPLPILSLQAKVNILPGILTLFAQAEVA